ncbi:MAG: hypothetical protein IJB34_00030 [Clostridia bacterium]|nr:hypothetical protein [Clostridia bacterium]MBQ3505792.1 hypothetical protein [Clostridia bacterium]
MEKRNVALIVAGVAVAVVAFAGASAVMSRDSGETELKARHYEIGRLDSVGKFDEDDSGIVTKKYYKVAELKSIEVKEDVTYYVNVYDKDKTFIQVDEYTDDLTDEALAQYTELGAVYFKLEVVNDEDDEIGFFDRYSLAGDIEVVLEEADEEE